MSGPNGWLCYARGICDTSGETRPREAVPFRNGMYLNLLVPVDDRFLPNRFIIFHHFCPVLWRFIFSNIGKWWCRIEAKFVKIARVLRKGHRTTLKGSILAPSVLSLIANHSKFHCNRLFGCPSTFAFSITTPNRKAKLVSRCSAPLLTQTGCSLCESSEANVICSWATGSDVLSDIRSSRDSLPSQVTLMQISVSSMSEIKCRKTH